MIMMHDSPTTMMQYCICNAMTTQYCVSLGEAGRYFGPQTFQVGGFDSRQKLREKDAVPSGGEAPSRHRCHSSCPQNVPTPHGGCDEEGNASAAFGEGSDPASQDATATKGSEIHALDVLFSYLLNFLGKLMKQRRRPAPRSMRMQRAAQRSADLRTAPHTKTPARMLIS